MNKQPLLRSITTRLTPWINRSMHLKNENISTPQETNDLISQLLVSRQPTLVSRLGSTEAHSCIPYFSSRNRHLFLRTKYLLGMTPDFVPAVSDAATLHELHSSSGVFPETEREYDSFCQAYIQSMKHIDVLGSWLSVENYYGQFLGMSTKVHLTHLNPLLHPVNSWTRHLTSRKVLIIHPFKASIEYQLRRRDRVFSDASLIPDADFSFLVPPQAYGGTSTWGSSWSENLENMKNAVNTIEFDAAILGCGAYGLPLGAHIRKIGKQAIHIGGDLQLLFGIMGTRWEGKSWLEKVYTDHWIRPLPEDRPKHFNKGERGQTPYW